jgi:hypothetical protein
MIDLSLGAKYSSDCQTLRVTDDTDYSGFLGRENITCRNLHVADPCGNTIYGDGGYAKSCIAITTAFRYEWAFGATVDYQVTSFLVDGINVISSPTTYTSLANMATGLSSVTGLTFSIVGNSLVTVTSTKTPGQIVGLQNGVPPTIAFAINPTITLPVQAGTFLAGSIFQVTICGKVYTYAALTRDLVYPTGGITVPEAVRLSSKNVALGLYALIKPDLATILCDCSLEVVDPAICEIGCLLTINSKSPNVPVRGVSVSSSVASTISIASVDEVSCNWRFKYQYEWDFTAAADPIASFELTGLLVNDEDVILLPISISATTRADQIAILADTLNTYAVGNFIAAPTRLIAVSSEVLGDLSYTPGPATLVPTKIISHVDSDDLVEVPIDKDGVYCATLTIQGQSPQYAQAYMQMSPSMPDDTVITIDLTGFPAPFSSFQVGWTGSTVSFAKAVEVQFNRLIVDVYGWNETDAYAYAAGTQVFFYLSIPFLRRFNGELDCGSTSVSLSVVLTGTGNPTLIANGSSLKFDAIPCIASRTFEHNCKQCFAVLCRLKCCFAEVALREYDSAGQMPLSMKMFNRIQAIDQRMCLKDYSGAQELVVSLASIANNASCQGCLGSSYGVQYASSTTKPCGCN